MFRFIGTLLILSVMTTAQAKDVEVLYTKQMTQPGKKSSPRAIIMASIDCIAGTVTTRNIIYSNPGIWTFDLNGDQLMTGVINPGAPDYITNTLLSLTDNSARDLHFDDPRLFNLTTRTQPMQITTGEFALHASTSKIVYVVCYHEFSPDRFIKKRSDGQELREQNVLCLYDISTGRNTLLAGGDYIYREPAFSPDGKFIAFYRAPMDYYAEEPDIYHNDVNGLRLCLVPAAGGEVTVLTPPACLYYSPTYPACKPPVWSSDGSMIYFDYTPTDLELAMTRPELKDYRKAEHYKILAERLPKKWGRYRFDLKQGKLERVYDDPLRTRKSEKIVDERTGKTTHVPVTSDLTYDYRWSPDGEWIAYLDASKFPGLPDLVVMRADGSNRMVVDQVTCDRPWMWREK